MKFWYLCRWSSEIKPNCSSNLSHRLLKWSNSKPAMAQQICVDGPTVEKYFALFISKGRPHVKIFMWKYLVLSCAKWLSNLSLLEYISESSNWQNSLTVRVAASESLLVHPGTGHRTKWGIFKWVQNGPGSIQTLLQKASRWVGLHLEAL